MRVRKTLNRKVGDKEYHRWRIDNVPPETIETLGWKDGDELDAKTRDGRLNLERANTKKEK